MPRPIDKPIRYGIVAAQSINPPTRSPTMKAQITKFQLMTALFTGGPLKPATGVQFEIVLAVEREDGSGRSYNVTGLSGASKVKMTVCLTTID